MELAEREREFFPDRQWSFKERRSGFIHLRSGPVRILCHRHQSVFYIDYRGSVDGPVMRQVGYTVTALTGEHPVVLNYSNCSVTWPSLEHIGTRTTVSGVGVYIVSDDQYQGALEHTLRLAERHIWRVVYLKSQMAAALSFAQSQAALLRSVASEKPKVQTAGLLRPYQTQMQSALLRRTGTA